MFYSNKSSILVSGEGNSSRSKMTSFMRILNLQRIVFLMCIVSYGEITWGMKDNREKEIEDIKLESESEEEINLKYNVVFLGDTKVGKTQIINKYFNRPFDKDYNPTFGINEAKSTINKDNSHTINLTIWDSAGEEAFRVSLSYVQSAHAIVLVYDVTQKESFDKIKENWLDPAKGYKPNAIYFLVGNKTDLEKKKKVEKTEAQEFANENHMQFFEVSATDKTSIDKLFNNIINRCLIKDKYIKEEVIKEEVIKDYKPENEQNTQNTTTTNNKGCICCRCCPCNK